uniref:DUF3715 domain-containing protein n=1 Tax=Neogobius melanostomus TaxID=47308 RepID=A0A8C6T247_9GOBI
MLCYSYRIQENTQALHSYRSSKPLISPRGTTEKQERAASLILARLQSAYLFEESKHSFKYTAAFLIRNSYNTCREKRREQGYIDEDLKETFGFLLFDELGKAKSIGETGVLTGNGTCTTLGDPTKGVYLSMYSDCLDLNRWYHGKSGYIAILRLTQGRVKKWGLTAMCLNSCPRFHQKQVHFWPLKGHSTAQSPSLACPYAIVAFSYTDTKETQQEKSLFIFLACPYSPWMGTLQIGSQIFNIEIRSTAGALTRAKLPPVIKVEQAISMSNLRKLLPKATFDTTLNGKEDLICSLCEIVALSLEEKEKLSHLLKEIKEKDVALIISLSDGSFLVLIHGSHFICRDNGRNKHLKFLQGVFVFPEFQAIQKGKVLPSDALCVLPLLTYAEGEIEKTSLNTNEDLSEKFVHYMQSYATLISPDLPSSPFRDVGIFPDQYDVLDTHGHLYSTPEWTDKQWQCLKMYLNNANSFQLPVSKAYEIFAAGQEVRREDLEDDIYICLSSPEEPSTNVVSTGSENIPDQECTTTVELPQDTSQQVSTMSQMVPNAQTQGAISETSNSETSNSIPSGKDNKCAETSKSPLRTEPSEELIVCITSAAQTVGDEGLATLNSLSEIVQSKITLNCSDGSNLVADSDMLPLGHNLESAQSPSLQIVKTLLGKDESLCMDHLTTQELEKHLDTSETQGDKQEKDKSSSKTSQVLEQAVDACFTDNALLKELETCTLRKKSERWGLKPVISTCGRIFVPFGSVDPEQIESLQEKLRLTKDELHPKEIIADALSDVSNVSKNKQETGDDKETPKPTEEALGSRLKMLKKNQRVSAEQVKKKWWLHFQTPTCYAEKQYDGCSRDISVRKTVKEKTDTSSEALNLLADLALSANKEQVSPHPMEACLQEFGSSLKKCEITKDVSNPEQQSVLHALLKHASKPIQPSETPSPNSFGGSELVDVICQEHAYSLPSSPSLLLALPAPFQVSPLNGSSRLLHTKRQWEGAQTIHPIFSPEEIAEWKRRDPGDPQKSWYRRKFCLLRTIVNKEKSVQVTRHWEGLYDFNLDSRFAVDPKEKTIVRALHGPWDYSIQDTTEEVQLIVHMWIGLFYSRSTARFFHLDPDMTLVFSEDGVLDAVDASIVKGHERSVSETVLSCHFASEERPEQCVTETILHCSLLNTSSCHENSLINQSVVRRQHVFAFPKAFTTSIVTETCTESRSERTSFNTVVLPPLLDAENRKCTSIIDSVSVSNIKEKDEPAGQSMTMGCTSKFTNQDTLVENAMDCSLSQDESVKTVEASLINETNKNNSSADEVVNDSGSVTIPFLGCTQSSIENMLKGKTSNEMDEEKAVEDMEIATSDSSSACTKITATLPTYADSTSHNQPSDHIKNSVAESEFNNPFDIGDCESDDRCPTPTIDEQPYIITTTKSNLKSSGNYLEKVPPDGAEKEAERSSTPVLDEASVEGAPLTINCDEMTKVGAQSDIELRTLRTLQCLDEFLCTLHYKSNQFLLNGTHTPDIPNISDKESAALIHDSHMSDSCPPESKPCASPSNDVLESVQEPKENGLTPLLTVPVNLPKVASKPVSSTEKPDQATKSENERPKWNLSSCSTSPCPDKGQMITLKQTAHLDCDSVTRSKPIKFSIKRTKRGSFVCRGPVFEAHKDEDFADNLIPSKPARPVQQDVQNLQCTEAVSSIMPTQAITSEPVTELDTHARDKTGIAKNVATDNDLLNCTTSFVDSKTNKITDDSLGTEGSLSCTVTNTKRKEPSFLEKVSQRCLQDDPTQASMDQECLIFLDKIKLLLKRKNQCLQVKSDPSNLSSSSPIIVQFSHLQEQDDDFGDIQIPLSFFDQKISVEMSDREQLRDIVLQSSPTSLPHGDLEQPGVSAITAECGRLYRGIMDKICSGNRNTALLKDLHKMDSDDTTTDSCNYFDFCSQMKREMDDSFRNRLNSVVKKSCKTKNRFFLFVTSDDVFFSKTREYLEAEGHIAVQPSDFFLRESNSSPLLVIIRNEDIAEHIFKVPHLLQLRTSPVVQFAGIDEPDDVVNLTYQEVFIKGGFVMFDRAAVESLSAGNMKNILEILQRLIQTGKWKWMLHYRDIRRLKENARLCPDAKEKTDLLNKCKEDGLLDILPYHECDLMSREQPNYLRCLCHQQVQTYQPETDKGFEKNGIVTMTVNSFLMDSLHKIINFT